MSEIQTDFRSNNQKVLMFKNESLTSQEAFSLLANFDPKIDPSTTELNKPQGGEVFYFYTEDPKESEDWKMDKNTWYNNGQKLRPGKVNPGEPQVYKIYHLLKIGNEKYKDFVKYVLMLPNTKLPVIVQYIGNHEIYKTSCHGNSKNANTVFERKLPLDVVVLIFHKLSVYYHNQIIRGFCNRGNYVLKDDYSRLLRDFENVVFRPTVTIESIVSDFKNCNLESIFEQKLNIEDSTNSNTSSNSDSTPENSVVSIEPVTTDVPKNSKIMRAKWFVEKGLIQFCSQMGCFNIRDVNNNVFMVTLYPKPVCSCYEKTDCSHIIAVQISIGAVDVVKKVNSKLKLTKLKEKKNLKSGRKYRDNEDEEIVPVKNSTKNSKKNKNIEENMALNVGKDGSNVNEIVNEQSVEVTGSTDSNELRVYPKILKKKQKNILLLNDKDFDFKKLINESDLLIKPEDLPDGVVNIDFFIYRNCFSDEGYLSIMSVVENKKKHLNPKRDRKLKTNN
ncbi:hypothetical protein BpHYR1_000313 [Brachionus plicatilis]|uniref:SWIM-type domain-containing protein n=1 Tax=Brachionus plicatilis TaxID=10195 RepID=A0A3M7SHV3_BRAPC|nr:hypothetical protein BpHYR1_000313 [Brachionus plicatilis]